MAQDSFIIGLGNRIRELRLKNKMSQNDLAMLCNFEKATMSRIESGKSNPTVRTLIIISRALDVHIVELFRDLTVGRSS